MLAGWAILRGEGAGLATHGARNCWPEAVHVTCRYQQRLQASLMWLAAVADAQTQAPAGGR